MIWVITLITLGLWVALILSIMTVRPEIMLGACAVSFLVILWLILAAPAEATLNFTGCGFKPLKPLIPLGCRDLVAQCICDGFGKNCSWAWICVQ